MGRNKEDKLKQMKKKVKVKLIFIYPSLFISHPSNTQ